MPGRLWRALAQSYGLENWRGTTTLATDLFIWRFYLSGAELPGMQAHSLQAEGPAPEAPVIQSAWHPAAGPADALLTLDVFKCASRPEAHDFLIDIVAQYQSPDVRRREGTAGDVAFSAG